MTLLSALCECGLSECWPYYLMSAWAGASAAWIALMCGRAAHDADEDWERAHERWERRREPVVREDSGEIRKEDLE